MSPEQGPQESDTGWNHQEWSREEISPSTVGNGGRKGPAIGETRQNQETWMNEQKDIDELEEFQRNVDILRITYKGYIEEKNLKEITPGKSIVSINVRSLEKNHDRIEDFLRTVDPTVACIQEVWQHNRKFPGYNTIQRVRKNKRGGGVAILVKEGIEFEEKAGGITPNIEYLSIKIKQIGTITNIYLPPANTTRASIDTLKQLINSNETNYILGDFNINFLDDRPDQSEASPIEWIHEMNAEKRLFPLTLNPTRVTEKTATLIDNILTNERKNICTGVIAAHIADHLYPFVIIKDKEKKQHKNNPKMIKIREMKETNKKEFLTEIKNQTWEEIKQATTAHEKTEILHTIISNIYDECFPEKEVKLNKNIHAKEKFMTRGLLVSRNRGKKMYAKWIKQQKPSLLKEYTEYDRLYRKVARISKVMDTEKMYKDNYKDTRKIWQLTNEMLRRKSMLTG